LKPLVLVLLASTVPGLALADTPPCAPGARVFVDGLGTPSDDLLHAAELAGVAAPTPNVIRRAGAREVALCADGAALPWRLAPAPQASREASLVVATVPFRLQSAFNSTYPSGANDGLLWAGRGVSGVVSGGVAFRWRFLSAALVPEVAASANEPFELAPNGFPGELRFSDPFYGGALDLPQRFGDDPFAAFAPGQSFVRADLGNLAVGFSTENLWLGPGQRNTLLMSNAGPGFPHAFVGTSRPGDVWIGRAEALLFWGQLSRTDYFVLSGSPLVTGLALSFSPRWVPTLTLGGARVFVQPFELSARRLLQVFESIEFRSVGDDPAANQLASLFFRWALPSAGFEVYGEWGREDYEADVDDLIREPDHGQAWLVGLQKVWSGGPRWIRLQAELTHLQEQRPLENARGVPVWYVHPENRGYTHGGQLLGAWVGPGADAQLLAIDVFTRGGRVGGFVERVRRNEEYYWRVVEPTSLARRHDTEVAAGARGVVLRRGVELGWEAALAYRWNRAFLPPLDASTGEVNLRLALSIAFGPGTPRAGR
jgi:hypothetical protein